MHQTKRLFVRPILSLLALLVAAGYPGLAHAFPPQGDLEPNVLSENATLIGVTSTVLPCLAAGGPTAGCPESGTVELSWQGTATSARVVLSIPDLATAPRAPHTVLVNGQAAAELPICSAAQPCVPGESFYLDIPPKIVVQGDNQIKLLGDGQARTVIAGVRLQVRGSMTPARASESEGAAAEICTKVFPESCVVDYWNLEFPGDPKQEASVQIPDSYDLNDPDPTPLVVYAHGRTGIMEDGIDQFGAAANARGWLLISPQMHGSWNRQIAAECFVPGNNCLYEDQVLAGTTPAGGAAKPGAYAHASRESQYDVLYAVKYMVDTYSVRRDQIYLVGGSMGGQTAYVTAAKFPHLFAAAYAWMGISDLGQWYGELTAADWQRTLRKECNDDGVYEGQIPTANPFCYNQRSGVEFGRNFAHIPISMTHHILDELVFVDHSHDMVRAINDFRLPDDQASVDVVPAWKWCGRDDYHCVDLDPYAVLEYLDDFRLNNNPDTIRVASDESKLYYWMDLTQTGDPHWSHVDVTRDADSPTVEVAVSDTHPIRIDLNLGTGSRLGEVMQQPGMGLPATTYLVEGAGHNRLVDYGSGYLTAMVNTTGTSSFTVSAITITLDAEPSIFSARQATKQSTLTIQVQDQNVPPKPVPDGTSVRLTTTTGTFSNDQKSSTHPTTGGQVSTTLTLDDQDESGEVVAEVVDTVHSISAVAQIEVIHPSIDVAVSLDVQEAQRGKLVTYQYVVRNTGDSPLSGVTVTDDNGTPGESSDDVTVCASIALQVGQQFTCSRQKLLEETTTITATATGVDLSGNTVSHQATATVAVRPKVFIPLVIK